MKFHLLVRNVPESDLAVKGARDKELIVPGMELYGGDELDVLEDAKAFQSTDVPQPDRLVHAAREDKEVFGPGYVKEVAGVPGVGHEGPVHEDVSSALRVLHVVPDCLVLVVGNGLSRLVLHLISSPHLVKVLVFVPEDPDPEDTILACGGQQPAAQ